LGRLIALSLGSSMFLGIALAFTALPVSIGILTDLELLETDFGRSIVSAGLLIAVDRLFRYRHGVLASWLLRASRHLVTKGAPFALPFIVALGFAFLADYLGLHFVVGAFFGTLLVAEYVIGDRDAKDVRAATAAVTQGFLGPIFFAFIGLSVVVKSLADAPLVLSILAVAVLSKFIGGYAGARWSKFSQRYSVAAGVAMNGRGAMELVVAAI